MFDGQINPVFYQFVEPLVNLNLLTDFIGKFRPYILGPTP